MKRSEMLENIASELVREELNFPDFTTCTFIAKKILARIEREGMAPPRVSEEDCQAIMSIYYAGYTFHQWDEDLEKDVKVQEAKARRAKIPKKGL